MGSLIFAQPPTDLVRICPILLNPPPEIEHHLCMFPNAYYQLGNQLFEKGHSP